MSKYLYVIKNTWDEILTYRLSFVLWRLRTIFQLLTIYFLWLTLIPKTEILFGYSQSLILTYVIGTAVISAIVFSTRTYEIGDNINSGNLSAMLTKPISYFGYWWSRDIGDKLINISFSIIELLILFLLLKPSLFIQTKPEYLLFTVMAVILAIVLHFFIGAILGMIGFWSPEVWAPRFIFFILVQFFSGVLFPLDIFPKTIFTIFQLLPFPYLMFFPLKIFLGQLSIGEISQGIAVTIVWIFLLWYSAKLIWQKGLKIYTAYGN